MGYQIAIDDNESQIDGWMPENTRTEAMTDFWKKNWGAGNEWICPTAPIGNKKI